MLSVIPVLCASVSVLNTSNCRMFLMASLIHSNHYKTLHINYHPFKSEYNLLLNRCEIYFNNSYAFFNYF